MVQGGYNAVLTEPGMAKRCRDFGRDLARGPVEVGPTTHFLMGGVVVDTARRIAIEGLFAAGEDTGGIHGANRLGGNGVAESTAFGGIAGDVMAESVTGRPLPRISGGAWARGGARGDRAHRWAARERGRPGRPHAQPRMAGLVEFARAGVPAVWEEPVAFTRATPDGAVAVSSTIEIGD